MGPPSATAEIPDEAIVQDHMVEYGPEEKPVFLGHYWMEGNLRPSHQIVRVSTTALLSPAGSLLHIVGVERLLSTPAGL